MEYIKATPHTDELERERKRMKIKIYENGVPEEAKEIRNAVFVQEQGFVDEFDEIDERAAHILLYDEEDKPIGTCRVFKDTQSDNFVLGRLAVKKEFRGRSIGSEAIKAAEGYVREKKGNVLTLHAQCRASYFYRQNGYEEYGEIEDDQGCPHIWMRKYL